MQSLIALGAQQSIGIECGRVWMLSLQGMRCLRKHPPPDLRDGQTPPGRPNPNANVVSRKVVTKRLFIWLEYV